MILLSACSKPKKHADDKPKKEDKPPVAAVGIGAGNTTVYPSAVAKTPSFSLRWEKGRFDVSKGGVDTGRLEGPSGEIYSGGKPASTYRADEGGADKAANLLTMTDNVVVQSMDKAYTLKAAKAEYRGDAKIVRATGGVAASGPFGTLSGVPEVWSTPDFLVIGTPDMVSKTLKIPALAALAATAATGTPQAGGKDYTISPVPASFVHNLKTGRYIGTPRPGEPVVVTIKSRNLAIKFYETVVIDFVGKTDVIRHMKSAGKVGLVQTGPEGTTTIGGAGVDYDFKPGSPAADVDLEGPVEIVRLARVQNAAGKTVDQTTTTRGDKGNAVILNKPEKGQDGLRSATLTGNVTIDVSEVDGQSFSGSGSRLVYTPNGATAGVEMAGRTTLTSVARDKDGTRTTVTKGDRGSAALFSKPAPGTNPLKSATLVGNVVIDAKGPKGETFKGSGDKIVYAALGDDAKVTMTGALRFSGDAGDQVGDVTGYDTVVMTLAKGVLETVEGSNSTGAPGTTAITGKPKKAGGKP